MPVLTSNGGPIYFSVTDTQITVSRDGVVSTENGEIGRLRIVRFENPNDLQAVGDGLLSSPDRPAEMDSVNLIQGMLEGSNVEPIVEMERMIRLHRAYDSARLLIDKEDERIKRMVQVYSG
jgi:flagellar basal-body rod protein FlgF